MKKLLFLSAACFFMASLSLAQQINVNEASSSELQMLKGVGPKYAEKIIEARRSGGPFSSLDDVARRVKGIGPKTVAKWKEAGNVVALKPGSRQAAVRTVPVATPAPIVGPTLERTVLIKAIADILQEHGYKNYQVNIAVAAKIADYLKDNAGVTLE
jgi:competence protein ComEA